MTISVNWATDRVIFVPKADTTLIQASPEVREFDAAAFHYDLRTIEATGTEGVVWPQTHDHIGESTLSGITYGRQIEILAPYTVEFEDGQYGVSVVGANTNLLDVKVPNQVSLLGNNSAGLINLNPILAQLSYRGEVWIDTVGGAAGIIIGTNGVPSNPVSNISDAITIANLTGIKSFRLVRGTLTLTQAFVGWTFTGFIGTTLDPNGQDISSSIFIGLGIVGAMSGTDVLFRACDIDTLTGFSGVLRDCSLDGTVALVGYASFDACHSHAGSSLIDFGGLAASQLTVRGYYGDITLQNISHAAIVASLDMDSGGLTLDASCTAGTVLMRGTIGPLVNNSTGLTIVQDGRIDPVAIQFSSFGEGVHVNTSGEAGTDYPIGQASRPVNNMADAATIAAVRGISGYVLHSNLTIASGSFNAVEFSAESALRQTLTMGAGASFATAIFDSLTVDGVCSTPAEWYRCRIEMSTVTGGVFRECAVSGNITMQGPYDLFLLQCAETEPGLTEITIDMGGSGRTLGVHDFYGSFTLANKTGVEDVQINIASGTITLDATVTNGTIRITGMGTLIDNSTGSAVVDSTGFLHADVWGQPQADNVTAGSMGELLDDAATKAALAAALSAK